MLGYHEIFVFISLLYVYNEKYFRFVSRIGMSRGSVQKTTCLREGFWKKFNKLI